MFLYIMKENGALEFYTDKKELQSISGDTAVSLIPPTKEIVKVQDRLEADCATVSVKRMNLCSFSTRCLGQGFSF